MTGFSVAAGRREAFSSGNLKCMTPLTWFYVVVLVIFLISAATVGRE